MPSRSLALALLILSAWMGGCGASPRQPAREPVAPASAAELEAEFASSSAQPNGPRGPFGEAMDKGLRALEKNELDEADSHFRRALELDAQNGDVSFYLGVIAEKQGRGADAERLYQRVLELAPSHEQAALNLSALWIDGKRFSEAADLVRRVLPKAPRNAGLRTNLAVALANLGKERESDQAFSEAFRLGANDAMTRLTYGHFLASWNRRDDAAREFAWAVSAAGNDMPVLIAIGHEQRAVGAFGACIATLSRVLDQRANGEARVERGLCHVGAKNDDAAVADFEAAAGGKPPVPAAHFYWAGVLARAGRWKEAAGHYAAYLSAEPRGPLAGQASERMKAAKERVRAEANR